MPTSRRTYPFSTLILVALTAAVIGSVVTAVVVASPQAASEASSPTPSTSAEAFADTAETPTETPAAVPDLARRIDGDPLAIGALDAPVVMIEYADYRCPFCSLFARDTLPPLIDSYVADGTLRVEWRDLPLFGEQSINAAIAARAAGEQGLFWDYQEAVHAAAPDRGHPELPREQLIAFAAQIGVPDLAAFEQSLDSPAHAAAIQIDVDEARALGIAGTPAFLVGAEMISGAQPLEVFQLAIERQAGR
ncbi:DsbA family protein [Glaciibacter psychrotolerans]|uniref:Protein-disulfide isomerase n=1 Tax=Glaciibacter psychrotolerans TaxID=670054 RepID=A0A7Z0J4U0_9MICO|nr:thioredoxin domain-containing protein [Leifsonia psychrotolerans]NYJ18742.1 protein-disulfide isomerase [Leifsonia psychrotolerans]